MNLYVHPQKESVLFSVEESIAMECADDNMPGKAAGVLNVCNSKWSCQTGNRGSEINGMVFNMMECKI